MLAHEDKHLRSTPYKQTNNFLIIFTACRHAILHAFSSQGGELLVYGDICILYKKKLVIQQKVKNS